MNSRPERVAKKRPHAISISKALGVKGERQSSVRVQLTLKSRYAPKLEELRAKLNCESYAEAVRKAIDFTIILLELTKNAERVYVESADGSRTYVRW
jgi:hypothetical protein